MTHKLKELGCMLLVLTVMGVATYLYAGLHVRDDDVAIDYCITTP